MNATWTGINAMDDRIDEIATPFLGKGKLITIEGADGSGKSTQAYLLAQRLTHLGVPVVLTREPGGCPFSERLRQLLVSGQPDSIHEKTELLLMIAARIEHVRQVIGPSLERGQWVVCDRFFDSTMAYQGYGRGIDRSMIEAIHRWAMGSLTPHLTILLTLDAAERRRRLQGKLDSSQSFPETRFEQEGESFQDRVHAGFMTLAKENDARFFVIDGFDSRENIGEKIWINVWETFSRLLS
ncbi:MAG: dTMP kinase [Magnetococcales bacterium]|nr:dTMP kinase [Magnetococcales bacterium]